MEQKNKKILPLNAYTELKPGEKYLPVVPADRSIAEITKRSVFFGVLMAIIFSFSAAYLGLKVGQVFEAAIPIAILAVGISNIFARKNTILENVIIQSIGAASGVVVAGGIFVLPAFYILGMDKDISLLETFLAAFLGGSLGILFLIPLRRFFCVEEHGKLPFPEATATTEILATGEAGGSQARVLVWSMIIGGVYDFVADVLYGWNYHLETKKLFGNFGAMLADKYRMVLKLDAITAILGLGYIIGFRYSAVIVAGGILSNLVLVPAVFFFGQHLGDTLIYPGTKAIAIMTEREIFAAYVQKIGIGAIACAGIIGIIKASKIIFSSFTVGFKEIFGSSHAEGVARTDRDISMKWIITLIGIFLLCTFIFFSYVSGGVKLGGTGLLIVAILAFLFTTVAVYATAIVGSNPVSGMTVLTLIITSVILSAITPIGQEYRGMIIALIMGCVVCTALSMAGGFITDLKVGYWLGATPRNQQRWKFLGCVVSAICVSLAILVINKAYGFAIMQGGALVPNPNVPAPQGNLMATIIQSLMDRSQEQPWILYGIGALITVMLEMSKIPLLPFALGMYLPIPLTTPLLLGGFLAWLVEKSSKNKEVSEARRDRGILITSGFIAGGALMGMLGAVLNLDWLKQNILQHISLGMNYVLQTQTIAGETIQKLVEGVPRAYYAHWGQWIGLITFIGICLYVYFDSRRAAKD